jgi:UDP-3-O-[3-hydroxymyristoyl] glucosamine N-acyltransferase
MAGTVALAGSVTVGKRCTLGGGVGVNGHIEVADHVHVTGRSVIWRSISEPGVYSSGLPLQENRAWHRNYPRFAQLDEMYRRLKALEDESGER